SWSTAPAARSARWQDRPNGRATTRSSSSMRRSADEHDPEKWEPVFGKDHAPERCELSRDIEVLADTGGDVGEAVEIFLCGVDHLHDRFGGVRIHLHHLGGEGHLHFGSLGADEGRCECGGVHQLHIPTQADFFKRSIAACCALATDPLRSLYCAVAKPLAAVW